MQRFRVVYHGISHERFTRISLADTHEPPSECAYEENTSDKRDIP